MFTVEAMKVSDAFGIEGVDTTVDGYKAGHIHQDFVPDGNDNYVFRRDVASTLLAWWMFEDAPLYLWGPMGSGKTSGVLEMCSRMNIPVQLVSCHSRLETPELVGRYVLNDEGGMDFVDGPLTTAMRHGHLLILDEIDLLDPGTAAGLNGLREGLPLTIPETGESVRAKKGFRLVVTANTQGNGDEHGVYPGTNRLNQAFLDGFCGMRVDYATADAEIDILRDVLPGHDDRLLERMVDIANQIRRAFMGNPDADDDDAETIEITMSTRSLIQWARWRTIVGDHPSPWTFAMERALTWRATPEAKAFIDGIIEREMG